MFKKRKNLTQKLKKAVENISADVFGYEKKIAKNVIQYLEQAGKEEGILYEHLCARIVRERDSIRVFLFHNGRQLKEIPVKELVVFFAGTGADLLGIEDKVVKGIIAYMDGFARFHEVPEEQLQIHIVAKADEVVVSAYNQTGHIKDIPVKELIKFFKP